MITREMITYLAQLAKFRIVAEEMGDYQEHLEKFLSCLNESEEVDV